MRKGNEGNSVDPAYEDTKIMFNDVFDRVFPISPIRRSITPKHSEPNS